MARSSVPELVRYKRYIAYDHKSVSFGRIRASPDRYLFLTGFCVCACSKCPHWRLKSNKFYSATPTSNCRRLPQSHGRISRPTIMYRYVGTIQTQGLINRLFGISSRGPRHMESLSHEIYNQFTPLAG